MLWLNIYQSPTVSYNYVVDQKKPIQFQKMYSGYTVILLWARTGAKLQEFQQFDSYGQLRMY